MPPKPRRHLPPERVDRKTRCGTGGQWPVVIRTPDWVRVLERHRCAICESYYRAERV